MRGFQICHNFENLFSISDFPLKSMCKPAPVVVDRILTFIKKFKDAFNMKTFDPEQLEQTS